jgi:hypothetical protein
MIFYNTLFSFKKLTDAAAAAAMPGGIEEVKMNVGA